VMRQHAQPIADVLVKEVAKPAADAFTGEGWRDVGAAAESQAAFCGVCGVCWGVHLVLVVLRGLLIDPYTVLVKVCSAALATHHPLCFPPPFPASS
jgi:hypothetical protein